MGRHPLLQWTQSTENAGLQASLRALLPVCPIGWPGEADEIPGLAGCWRRNRAGALRGFVPAEDAAVMKHKRFGEAWERLWFENALW